jgi:hypothetical protein
MRAETPETSAKGKFATAVREVREHPAGYAVLVAFAIAGPFVTHFLFPDAPSGLGLIGGVVFGMYAALCAVPGEFM